MHLSSFFILLTASTSAFAGRTWQVRQTTPQKPLKWGILAFPKFVGLDAFGPMDMLNIVKGNTPNMTISIIAETLDPVPSHINSDFGAVTYLRPTHTMQDDPELDVLMIPGGPGSRQAYNNTEIISYVQRTYPKLQYIVSVCTGAQVLAKAGILDGKKATTNKFSWQEMVNSGPTVDWVPCARWVQDGNIWTSSGVAAGLDLTHAFVSTVMGNETLADRAANILEIEIHKDASFDPFCEIWNVTGTASAPTTPKQNLLADEADSSASLKTVVDFKWQVLFGLVLATGLF